MCSRKKKKKRWQEKEELHTLYTYLYVLSKLGHANFSQVMKLI